jgi:arabinogalactan oligomer/maltooligosaccharide transport system substrate-binding protein
MMRCLPLAVLLLLSQGCLEQRSNQPAGWAAEVPAGSVRYLKQVHQAQEQNSDPTSLSSKDGKQVRPSGRAAPEGEFKLRVTEPAIITLWHAYRSKEKAALKQIMKRFAALNSPIKVKLQGVPFDAFNDKIKIVLPKGRGPDLFIFAHDVLGAWSEMGFLEPLNQWTSPELALDFIPKTINALVYKNALYGLPLAFKCVALYYNKALISAPPTTADELIRLAKQHTDGRDKFGLVYEAANLYFHAPWVHGFGGITLDEFDKAHLDGEGSVAALTFAQTLVKTHRVTPQSVTTAMVSGYFNDGSAAMVINGPWMRGEIEGVDYGVAPLPKMPGGRPAQPFLTVEAVFMNRHSKQKPAAAEVMRFLVSNANARIRFEQGQQPVANIQVWKQASDTADANMLAFRRQADVAVVMPSSPRMQQIWTPANRALLSVIAGDEKPLVALKKAQRKAVRDMKRAGGGR